MEDLTVYSDASSNFEPEPTRTASTTTAPFQAPANAKTTGSIDMERSGSKEKEEDEQEKEEPTFRLLDLPPELQLRVIECAVTMNGPISITYNAAYAICSLENKIRVFPGTVLSYKSDWVFPASKVAFGNTN
ncbi:hypothetical protein BST61_g1690 [Cercospora zeina]